MNPSQQILSALTTHKSYARFLKEKNRRETFAEIVERGFEGDLRQSKKIEKELRWAYDFVYDKKVLPSMRKMQFGGEPISVNNSRIYNCSYLPIDSWEAFGETMFLLLGGSGVGYSVQKHHVNQLPIVRDPREKRRKFLIGDSIEGWADAVKRLCKAYFLGKTYPVFDYRGIREKGAELVTAGGKAPGPAPLKICLTTIETILNNAIGRRLTPLEAHDILCHIADAVLAGGIRRAAMISLFDHDDHEMAGCKTGNWYELNPQRGRANNSAMLNRIITDYNDFMGVWEFLVKSGSGEPGFFWTNDSAMDWGCNPCCEIGLQPMQFCNLTTINASEVRTQEQLNDYVRAASIIGTMQASYTDFHYLRYGWQKTTESEALLGVSMTGICSGNVLNLDLTQAARVAVDTNIEMAKRLGIRPAARVTTVKPEGSSSCVLGTSSGIHAWHAPYYIRRVRVGKDESIYNYMVENFPQLVEDEVGRPDIQAVISIPQKAPAGAICRGENPLTMLERVKKFFREWVCPGHVSGVNTNNVSNTVNVKSDEWDKVGKWMWENREYYSGISCFPFSDPNFPQLPFEEIDEKTYKSMSKGLHEVDLTQVVEKEDNTNLTGEIACAGGVCDVE